MPKFYYDIEQNSAGWLEIRAGKVTASEIHRIITPGTLKPSSQSTGYAHRLIAERILGRPLQDSDYQSEYMELGHENEAATVASFELQTGLKTRQVGFVERKDTLAGCSPDRVILNDSGEAVASLEVKSPSAPVQVGYLLSPEKLVAQYRLQSQFQMAVCGFQYGYICSNHLPLPPVVVRVERDEELIDKINKAVQVLTNYVLDNYFKLELDFGPFAKPKPEHKVDGLEEFEVTEADIAWMLENKE